MAQHFASPSSAVAPVMAKDGALSVAHVAFVADRAGALYWPEQGLLAVADLHLEKGSSFAARGVLLPPYDTAATLERLAGLIARYAHGPHPVILRWPCEAWPSSASAQEALRRT